MMSASQVCPDCKGQKVILLFMSTVPCETCKGSGTVAQEADKAEFNEFGNFLDCGALLRVSQDHLTIDKHPTLGVIHLSDFNCYVAGFDMARRCYRLLMDRFNIVVWYLPEPAQILDCGLIRHFAAKDGKVVIS